VRKAYILGINRKEKFLRVMTEEQQLFNVLIQAGDLAEVRELLHLVESQDDC
jgi:hypothetical protein